MDEIKVPIYLMTGFLESGKTSFLSFTIQQDYFHTDGKTLLILCEEGEEEYDPAILEANNTVVEVIENEEDFTTDRLVAMDILHQPERVIIEYNGMWLVSNFEKMQLPTGWGVEQQITCVDGSTFQMYMANMKSIFMDMIKNTDMVIFNRCKKEDPLPTYRRGIKVANQRAEVIFEDENGEVDNIFEDEVPYDLKAPVIEIPREDYGIWYIDMQEHPERYKGKVVEFVAKVMKPKAFPSKVFYPGRMAMTCCADDTSFLGYVCRSAYAPKLNAGDWVKIRAKVRYANLSVYGGEGPVLEAENIESAEPIEELVYFN